MAVIRLARVYDRDDAGVGPRFLVERLWPRGVRRADLQLDDWLKDAGPSNELRRWWSAPGAVVVEECAERWYE